MPQIVVQDVWSPRTPPESPKCSSSLRPKYRRSVQGRVRGRVEGGVLRSGRRHKGHQDILKMRIEEGDQCELPVMRSSDVPRD